MMRSLVVSFFLFTLALPAVSLAASLSLSPSSGSYAVGDKITVKVLVSSASASINAVSGELSFPPSIFSVESVSKVGSMLNFWPIEPSMSQGAGTVNFEGVAISGFQGGSGTVISVTFRAVRAGSGSISFDNGQVLANDGQGTDITTGLSGAKFTITGAKAKAPVAEPVIAKKVTPPATTTPIIEELLQAPIITSVTKSVSIGSSAEVKGSSIYPNSTARLTLQGNSGPPLTPEVAVGENGVFIITQAHTLEPGDYIGSVVVLKDGKKSPPSGSFVINFEGKPFLLRLFGFLIKPLLLWPLSLLAVLILGFLIGKRYAKSHKRAPMHDTLHDVDVEVHKAFVKFREKVNNSIAELEEASKSRKLTDAEGRFIREMAGTIKDTERTIEKDIHDAEK